MDPSPTDAEVIAASRDEPERFGLIFDGHFASVHRYLDRRVGRDVADNLAAEVFRIAFQRRHAYVAVHGSARPWLFGIATNLVMKDRRHEHRRLRALARMGDGVRPAMAQAGLRGPSAVAGLRGPNAVAGADPFDRVDEELDARAVWCRLGPALAALDDRDRDVVVLVAWEGLSYEAVAAALQIPVGTVRSRLNRARKQLGERLGLVGDEQVKLDSNRAEGGLR